MYTDKDRVKAALGKDSRSVSEVSRISGLPNDVVANILSQLKCRDKVVSYKKIPGQFGKYTLIGDAKVKVTKDISLKISQLKSKRAECLLAGITLIDDIIEDYELMLKNRFTKKSPL